MSPLVARARSASAWLATRLIGLEELTSRLVGDPRVRWPAVLTLSIYLFVQAFSVAFQSALPSKLKSGFGFNIPWQMFAAPPPVTWYLDATAITATGQRLKIPVHSEIFTHYRGLCPTRAFEEAQWLTTPAPGGHMARKRELAIYFRDRMLGWGIEAVRIEMRVTVVPTNPKYPVGGWEVGSFDMPPPLPVPPYREVPPPDPPPPIPW